MCFFSFPFFSFFFFFFSSCTCSIWIFPGQESSLSCSCNLRQCQILNPLLHTLCARFFISVFWAPDGNINASEWTKLSPPPPCKCLFFASIHDTSCSYIYIYQVPCVLFHSCFDFQVPGRPVACVLPGDTWKEPLSGYAVVSALLWDVQGLLCPEAAAEELTSSTLAGSQPFAIAFIYEHTP